MMAVESFDDMLLDGFKNDSLKYLTDKSLSEIAKMCSTSPEEIVIELMIQDGSRVGTIFFLMSEENEKNNSHSLILALFLMKNLPLLKVSF